MTLNYYENSTEHLTEELHRIDLLLGNQYLRAKHLFENKGEFHGLYISDEDVDAFLKNPRSGPSWVVGTSGKDHSEVELAGQSIREKVQESRRRGIALKLDHLAETFGLTRSDLDLLILCMAAGLDTGYEKVFAYLQDDMTRKKLSAGLAMDILGLTFHGRLKLRDRLADTSPLVSHRLVHVTSDSASPDGPFVSRFLHADERIVSWLFDGEKVSGFPNVGPDRAFDIVRPIVTFDDLVLPDSLKQQIRTAAENRPINAATVLYFHGPYGTGRKSAVQAVCLNLNRILLVADLERIIRDHAEPRPAFRNVMREARLLNALVCWTGADGLFADDRRPVLGDFMDETADHGSLGFLIGNLAFEPKNLPEGLAFVPFEFHVPGYGQRIALWDRQLACENTGGAVDPERLAAAFAFTGGQIRDVVRSAKNHALKNVSRTVTETGLRDACLLQSSRKLATLARQIRPVYTWDDIVLPEDRLEQLRDIVNHARYRALVFDTWGFGRKLSHGKGLNILFSGPSGTGKTMAAEIMAGDLGLHLYKIDLARVVSKYIGETEKNLSAIFTEAETSNAILFFDEADAIFGRRSEVHDAHDRYANIETSYLLQKMEEYEGITILATNFKRNMDEAFVRRIQYAVDFPFPEKHHRHDIWRKSWPAELPLSADIDFDSLSGRFELSGGNIRNICLSAAFIAAADGKTVTMNHLVRATRGEYRKMGKLMMGGDFPELMSRRN